jgi:hypothetical protein
MALITVRTGGTWLHRLHSGQYVLTVADEDERIRNLRWAVESLRLHWEKPVFRSWHEPADEESESVDADGHAAAEPRARAKAAKPSVPENPRDASNLAEALEALPEGRAEAKTILEGLAKEDLITSAHGYAALARMRAEAADEDGARAAQKECRTLSRGQAQKVCVSTRPQATPNPSQNLRVGT